MSMTLAQAEALVQEHLDEDSSLSDPQWSIAQIDTALASALSTCLAEYTHAGGDRFQEFVTLSTTSGSIDLSSYNPASIDGVAYVLGSTRFSVSPTERVDVLRDDSESGRSFDITLTRHLALPSADSSPLIGIETTEINSEPMFANWVCLRAARQLFIKEGDRSQAIEAMEAGVKDAVMRSTGAVRSRTFPNNRGFMGGRYVWYYNYRTQALQFGYK